MSTKKEFVATYKCRLCGTLHCNNRESDRDIATKNCHTLIREGSYTVPIYMHYVHSCEDGSIGISDFVGYNLMEVTYE